VKHNRKELARFFVAGKARNGIEIDAEKSEKKEVDGYNKFPGTASSTSKTNLNPKSKVALI
jgi:hypothetical protein